MSVAFRELQVKVLEPGAVIEVGSKSAVQVGVVADDTLYYSHFVAVSVADNVQGVSTVKLAPSSES